MTPTKNLGMMVARFATLLNLSAIFLLIGMSTVGSSVRIHLPTDMLTSDASSSIESSLPAIYFEGPNNVVSTFSNWKENIDTLVEESKNFVKGENIKDESSEFSIKLVKVKNSHAEGFMKSPEYQAIVKETESIVHSVKSRLHPDQKLDKETNCLAENVFFESRGEPISGQVAVAMVTINRLRSDQYPKTICKVVHEVQVSGTCQFSWTCDKVKRRRPAGEEWKDAMAIAIAIQEGLLTDLTRGATHFHNTQVQPQWANVRQTMAKIGGHVFYKLN